MSRKKIYLIKKKDIYNNPLKENRDYVKKQLSKNAEKTDEELIKNVCKMALEEVKNTFLKKKAFAHMNKIDPPLLISFKDEDGKKVKTFADSVLHQNGDFLWIGTIENGKKQMNYVKFKDIDRESLKDLRLYYK